MTSRGIRGVRTARKERQWGITVGNGTVAAATQAGMLLFNLGGALQTAMAANFHNVTASAIRLNVTYRMTTSNIGEDVTVAAGIAWIKLQG